MVDTESAENVVINNMPVRIVSYQEDSFFMSVNIKKMMIENLTINIPSIAFEGVNCHLMIRNSAIAFGM